MTKRKLLGGIIIISVFMFVLAGMRGGVTMKTLKIKNYTEAEAKAMPFDPAFFLFTKTADDSGKAAFSLKKDRFYEIDKNYGIGYSSFVDMDAKEELESHYKATDGSTAEDKFGQLCAYRNFDGSEVFVFGGINGGEAVLNTALKTENRVEMFSSQLPDKDMMPRLVAAENEFIYVAASHGKNFFAEKIDVNTREYTPYYFSLPTESAHSLFTVDGFVKDGRLYVALNEYIDADHSRRYNEKEGYRGRLFSFNFESGKVEETELPEGRLDFVARSPKIEVFGSYGDGGFNLSYINSENSIQSIEKIPFLELPLSVTPGSAIVKDEDLYVNLSHSVKNRQEGYFVRINMPEGVVEKAIKYRMSAGSLNVRYFEKNTDFTFDDVYGSAV